MAKSDLFKTLRKRGLRKRVARAVADAEHGGAGADAIARDALADLALSGPRARGAEAAARVR